MHYRRTKRGGGLFDTVSNAASNASNAASKVSNAVSKVSNTIKASNISGINQLRSVSASLFDGGGRLAQLNLIMTQFEKPEFRRFKYEFVKLSGCDPENDDRFKKLIAADKDGGIGVDYDTRMRAANEDENVDALQPSVDALQPRT